MSRLNRCLLLSIMGFFLAATPAWSAPPIPTIPKEVMRRLPSPKKKVALKPSLPKLDSLKGVYNTRQIKTLVGIIEGINAAIRAVLPS